MRLAPTMAAALLLAWGCGPSVTLCDDGVCSEGTSSGEGDGSETTGEPTPTPQTTRGPGSTGAGPVADTGTSTSDGESSAEGESGEPPGPGVTPGDPTPCLDQGNILILDGDDGAWVWSGSLVLDDPILELQVQGVPVDDVTFFFQSDEGDPFPEHNGFVHMRTTEIPALLEVGEYPDAMRAPFEDPGHPGLDLAADASGCNEVAGWFEIHELETDGEALLAFTATWSHYCEGGRDEVRGCIHWSL